jgi:DNA polymerase-3 subunit epsilon/CBS domain-containing protein
VLADDFVYRAIGRIERLGIRHLAVRDAQGTIVGALTTRNLLRHRATTAIALGDEIDAASDAAALARAWSKLVAMASSLVEEGVDARLVAQVVSAEVCAMTRRAAELAEAELRASPRGPPPCAYAVLVLGSAGRGESLLAADQDNAIVFAEGLPDGPADRWLAAIGARMADILDAAGISYCKGGVMARNAVWRLSLDGWRRQIDGWIGRQRPQDLLNVDIFFDALVVHGDATLGQAITNYAFERAAKAPDFLNLLTELARDWRSPVGMLGGIKAGPDGRIDLKKGGLMPLFTAARVLAIRHGIVSRSTPERLAGVRARGIGSAEDFDSVIEAHRVLIDAILRQQLADAGRGVPLSPKVSVAGLDKAGKQRLRAALEGVGTMIGIVGEGRI